MFGRYCFLSECRVADISYTSAQFNCLSVSSRLVSSRETSTKRRKRSLIETAGITFPETTNGRALRNHTPPFDHSLHIHVDSRAGCCEWQQTSQSKTVDRHGNITSQRGLSELGLTQGLQLEGQLQRVSVCDGWEHLQDAHPLTNSSEMDRQEPRKGDVIHLG